MDVVLEALKRYQQRKHKDLHALMHYACSVQCCFGFKTLSGGNVVMANHVFQDSWIAPDS